MIELISGSICSALAIVTIFTMTTTGALNLFVILVGGIFLVVGISLIIRGLKKIIKNTLTSIKGEECFGYIEILKETGTSVNENPVYKAEIVLYVESEYEIKRVEEEIGLNPNKYPAGTYVKLKYYNNDINIIETVTDESIITDEIKRKIQSEVKPIDEIIEIDGVKYKRMY